MRSITVGLVGNPNSGKTTLFNTLTGAKQKVGNWPGVTVEKKSGQFIHEQTPVEVIDLPGTYSFVSACKTSFDERIACEYILKKTADVIVNVVDASNLERNLYLTAQLAEMGVPVIIALNMMDLASQSGWVIDYKLLAKKLGCAVVPIVAHKGEGIIDLKSAIIQQKAQPIKAKLNYGQILQQGLEQLEQQLTDRFTALRLLEHDCGISPALCRQAKPIVESVQQACEDDTDILIADARYQFVHNLVQDVCVKNHKQPKGFTAKLDRVVLNRFLGIPIFFAVMYFMFLFAINVGGAFQDFFDISTDTIFVKGLAQGLHALGSPTWFTAIIASGLGKGLNTTLTFIPVIGGMYLVLAFLEASGYMARAAFVMDRVMRALGLPGKSFVPLIVGFGCNVPSIMAARTLENQRDRILTILMAPFMSCSARLAIFAVFAAAFFPVGGQNVVFALYLIGIAMAILTGFVLRKTLLRGVSAPFILELPPYRLPTFRALMMDTWSRLKRFLLRAGKLIVPICVLIGALNAFTVTGHLSLADANQNSLLAGIGKFMTPIFEPMGISQNNWPATVGLLTGFLAKEVVVATLNTLYTQVGHLAHPTYVSFHFWAGMKAALMSIPNNLSMLPSALGNPILASAPDHTVNHGVYGIMYKHFGSQAAAFAYLLFVLLYVPCISAVAAVSKELNRRWAAFSVAWSLGMAYALSVIFYQLATLSWHPVSSLSWVISLLLMTGAMTFVLARVNLSQCEVAAS